MDIELLAKMVGELILDHDEVALPGLGTFVAEMVPASFSNKGFTINPPYRKLSFRQREAGDRSLIEFYSRANKVDEKAAERMIAQFVSELRMDLTSKKMVVFPRLGKLRATKENHFFFVPDEDLSIYPEGFGLVPVSLKSHQETAEEVSEAIRTLKDIVAPSVPETAAPEAPLASASQAPAEKDTPSPARPHSRRHEHTDSPVRRRMHPAIVAMLAAAGLAVVFLGSVAILGRVVPQLIDPLLYTQEELQIINM